MGLGSVRVDMNLAGGFPPDSLLPVGAHRVSGEIASNVRGARKAFVRGIFRFTVFPARTEGYGAIFAITV